MSTRRALLGALGLGILVTGFDPVRRSWATTAGDNVDPLPPLDGQVLLDTPSREGVSKDAGRYVQRVPQAVLVPGSVRDIQAMVKYCVRNRVRVAARGLANTTDGQGLSGGLIIEMRALRKIHRIDADRAVVDAGADWLQLTNAAHAKGLTPPALTGFLGLTFGGTLSLGGIPPAIQSGGQVDSVLELEVVTGSGELKRCSKSKDRELFEAVLAGVGQFGIITQATVRLGPAPAKVRGHELAYRSSKDFFKDFKTLIKRAEISEIYGDWWRPGERGEVSHLNAFTFHSVAEPPVDTQLLRGLTKPASEATVSQADFLPHVTRIDVAVEQLRAALDWDNLMKPWLTLWLPESSVEQFVTEVVTKLTPKDVGDGGFVLLYAHRRAKLTRPSLRLPASDGSDWVYLFTLMTAGAKDAKPEFAAEMLKRNRRLFDRARALGATRYPIESVPFTRADWQQHYGDRWPHLRTLKRKYDPAGVLTPGPGIF
ncbi:FAD-binding protein [Kribbella sandramycini]|uniref:FAD-binding protein n=1 Tax=Kribbella sandramycini TaxID=60450 RepID=A0A7Y4L088_9ACTN|nr:FAD-binding protein [Kribbella sandramycini]MBB6565641.1 FAD/FMN-containing dehydrogenase [Kribbella sandramycini]NOL41904.1 FAD-binding protein [Kribbella sandramycini]